MTEELKIEQTDSLNAQAAEAGMNSGAKKEAVSYGKFKDADALYSAYNSLQAEFTRRCQRLKEFEERDKKTAARGDTGADFGGKTKETAAKALRADENDGAGETEKTGMQGNFGDTLAEEKASSAASVSLKPNGDSLPIKSGGEKPERKVNPLLATNFTDNFEESFTDNPADSPVGSSAEKSVSEESTDTGEKVKNEKNSENKISGNENAFSGGAKPSQEAEEGEESPARVISEKEKEDVLKEYLEGILTKKTGAILMEGAGASLKTPRSRPKTVEEAGRLFRDSFGNIQ